MAGVKGRSGGARSGAGRKPQEPQYLSIQAASSDDPKAFLIAVMNDAGEESKTRIDAAKALLPYVCQKVGEVGKKEERQEAAKKVASRFSTAAPPKLVAAGGRKV